MNPEIVKLSPTGTNDFYGLIQVFEEVFEWDNFSPPATSHLQKVLADAKFMVFVAKVGEQLVGGLTAYVLDSYTTEKPSAYIYDVAVLPYFQRQGIGKALIAAVNDYCNENGFHEAFVQADVADEHAVSFYRTTPINSELQAVHFTYSFDDTSIGKGF